MKIYRHSLLRNSLLVAALFALVGCTAAAPVTTQATSATVTQMTAVSTAETVATEEIVATEAVAQEVAATEIPAEESQAENSASTSAAVSADTSITFGDSTTIVGEGAELTNDGVLITSGGTYSLSGTAADSMVTVDEADESVTLLLNGVSITNSDGPAVVFVDSGESNVVIVENTTNYLEDGGEHDDYDATLWSSATLNISGGGDLTVVGHYQEGIASEMHMNLNGGNIWVTSFDDGLNANNDGVSIITINDGYLHINSGGDGIDSNGTVVMNGGVVIASSALTDMSGGMDADGAVTVNGGTLIVTGARNSVPVATSAQQSLVVSYGSTQAADTLTAILDPSGNPIVIFAPEVEYQEVVVSTPEIAEGVTYTVYTDGTATGDVLNGWYANGTYTPGAQAMTVDTTSAENAGGFGPGGQSPARP